MTTWRADLGSLLANFRNTSLLRVVTSGLPFILYAYLFRVLGADSMGVLVFTLSIAAILRVFITFGFEVVGVSSVASLSEDLPAQARYAASVISIQCFVWLAVISISELIFFLANVQNQNEVRLILFMLLGELFWMKWFFQARLRMDLSLKLALISEVMICIFTVFLITESGQHADYIFIRMLITLLVGVIGVFFFLRVVPLQMVRFRVSDSIETVKEALPVFYSRLVAAVHDETSVLLIGAWFASSQLATFDLVRKLINLFCLPNSIINTVIFSYNSRERNVEFAQAVFWLRNVLAVVAMIVLVVFSEFWIIALAGQSSDVATAESYLFIMCLLVLIRAVIYYTGTSMLVAFGYEEYFNRSVYYTFVLFLVLMLFLGLFNLVSVYAIIGVILISESFEAAYRYYICKKCSIL